MTAGDRSAQRLSLRAAKRLVQRAPRQGRAPDARREPRDPLQRPQLPQRLVPPRVGRRRPLLPVDERGVCIRAGHHCAQPLMRRLGVPATARASFWVYSEAADVDALADGLVAARRLFGA